MQEHPYFIRNRVAVLAHRGFTPPTENTLEAFLNAIEHNADYLETDVRATKDGHAVLFHDADLSRIAGIAQTISQLTLAELQTFSPKQGGRFITLSEALSKLPHARFNIDIKEVDAVIPTVAAIEKHEAHNRVLVSSFSNSRRKKALKLLSQPVATSASGTVVLRCLIYTKLGIPLTKLLKDIGALQIPTKIYGMKLDSRRFINKVLATKTQIHFWTINDPAEIKRLIGLGAHAIVTDQTKLAKEVINNI